MASGHCASHTFLDLVLLTEPSKACISLCAAHSHTAQSSMGVSGGRAKGREKPVAS